MAEKVGRNDPCTCGSGKKYKQCCALKGHGSRRKFKATLISAGKKDLIERTFGSAITTQEKDLLDLNALAAAKKADKAAQTETEGQSS